MLKDKVKSLLSCQEDTLTRNLNEFPHYHVNKPDFKLDYDYTMELPNWDTKLIAKIKELNNEEKVLRMLKPFYIGYLPYFKKFFDKLPIHRQVELKKYLPHKFIQDKGL